MRFRVALLSLCALLVLGFGCRSSGAPFEEAPDAGGSQAPDASLPAAATDLVAAVGGQATLEIATWNLRNFPLTADSPRIAADLIASLELDFVALQEVEDVAALEEMVARLPGYETIYSAHTYSDGTYQKIAFVYDTEVVEVDAPALLMQNNGWEFPRPPFKVRLRAGSVDIDVIGIHLKAGLDEEDQQRRSDALALLEGYVRSSIDGSGDDDVIVLGDFNETLVKGADIFGPWLEETARYQFATDELVSDGFYTYIPSRALIDHIVMSTSMGEVFGDASALIPDLDIQLADYRNSVSDHLPVILIAPLE